MKLISLITGCGISMIIIITLISGVIGGFVWPYTINSWLLFLGKPATVTFLQGFVLGIIPMIGYLGTPIAAITWIIMLFL